MTALCSNTASLDPQGLAHIQLECEDCNLGPYGHTSQNHVIGGRYIKYALLTRVIRFCYAPDFQANKQRVLVDVRFTLRHHFVHDNTKGPDICFGPVYASQGFG